PASWAGRVASVCGQQHPHVHLVGARLEPVEEALGAVPLSLPGVVTAFPLRIALNDPLPLMLVEILPGCVQSDAATRGVVFHFRLAFLVAGRDRKSTRLNSSHVKIS